LALAVRSYIAQRSGRCFNPVASSIRVYQRFVFISEEAIQHGAELAGIRDAAILDRAARNEARNPRAARNGKAGGHHNSLRQNEYQNSLQPDPNLISSDGVRAVARARSCGSGPFARYLRFAPHPQTA
jgi:hypothetical protein